MNRQKRCLFSRSHLLEMTRLSQRAVYSAMKAYELNSNELCLDVHTAGQELRKLQLCIGSRGRTLLADGSLLDSDSLFACCALRIYSALHITCTAAIEIAQNTTLTLGSGRGIDCSEIGEMGKFVKYLVRHCTIAFFEEESQRAQKVLHVDERRRKFDRALDRARINLTKLPGTNAKCELAIARCLGHIAEQAYEIADAIKSWLEGGNCSSFGQERAA